MPTTPLERWRGRMWRMFAAGCVVLVIFHFAWAWHASRAMSRWKEDAHKRGLPLSVEELSVPDPEDDGVAFGRHVRAVKALSTTARSPAVTEDALSNGGCALGATPRPTLSLAGWQIPDHMPFPPKWVAAAEASEQANLAVFDLARQARAMGSASGRQIPFEATNLDWAYNGPINYALTLRDSADLNHVQGDNLQAIERLLDLMNAAAVFRQNPEPWMQVRADRSAQLAADSALFIAPGLAMDGRQSSSLRTSVRGLIAALLHPDPWNPRTLWHVRVSYIVYAESVINNDYGNHRHYRFDLPDVAGSRLLRQAFQTEELRTMRRYDEFAPAVGLENWPALRDYPFARQHRESFYDNDIGWLHGRLGNRLEIVAQRRAAAISLAARLYVADHGRWPNNLEEMVPEYLPHVPHNPLMPAGNAMGYIVLKGQGSARTDRSLVYYGEQPIELSNGIPADLPQSSVPLLPRNHKAAVGTRAYFDLSRFTTASP
ncbi:MAG: hypothetical protein ABSH20_03475 [Tepidisphaeraceae bacterium]|jgi:hypothetical protein